MRWQVWQQIHKNSESRLLETQCAAFETYVAAAEYAQSQTAATHITHYVKDGNNATDER